MADKNQQEKEFTIQPIDDTKGGLNIIDAIKSNAAPHLAAPGPALAHDHSQIQQEGTKEERLAKAQEANK